MESLTWRSHPARERPIAAILVVVFIILVTLVIYEIMDRSVLMAAIGGAILVVSLSTFFFPTTFTVDEKRVVIKYMFSAKDRNLSAFRKYYPGMRGVLLSPYLSPSRLENFRGFYLRYGKDNKAEVDEFVKRLLERQRMPVEPEAGEVSTDAV